MGTGWVTTYVQTSQPFGFKLHVRPGGNSAQKYIPISHVR
jgi:hypothetical protein